MKIQTFLHLELINQYYSVDRWGDIIYEDESESVLGQSYFYTMGPVTDTTIASFQLTYWDENYLPAAHLFANGTLTGTEINLPDYSDECNDVFTECVSTCNNIDVTPRQTYLEEC